MYRVFATYYDDLSRVLMASFDSYEAAAVYAADCNLTSFLDDDAEFFDYEVSYYA